jgi:hypothetical protein
VSGEGFGDFDFSSVKPTISEVLRAKGHRVFEITAEGSVTCHGYAVDEVILLLEGYRAHMIEFARGMQSLANGSDAVRYTPGDDVP